MVSICHFVPPKNKPFTRYQRHWYARVGWTHSHNTFEAFWWRFPLHRGACANIRVGLTILPYFPFSSTELKVVLVEGSQVIKLNSNLPRFQLYRIVRNVMLNTITNVVNNPNICYVEYSVYFLKKLYRMFSIKKYYLNE